MKLDDAIDELTRTLRAVPRPEVRPNTAAESEKDLRQQNEILAKRLQAVERERDQLAERVAVVAQREAELDDLRRRLFQKEAELIEQEQHLDALIHEQKELLKRQFRTLAAGGIHV